MTSRSYVRLLIVIAFGLFLIAVHVALNLLPVDDQSADARPLHPNVGARP